MILNSSNLASIDLFFLHNISQRKNFVEVIPDDVTSLRDGIAFLMKQKNHENVFVERGVTSMYKYFNEKDKKAPFDFFCSHSNQ